MNFIIARSYIIIIFSFLYRFTRQTFTPFASVINLPNFHNPNCFFRADNIASIFALIYALLQIPYGIYIDRYGINKTVTYLAGIMTLGLILTSLSPTAFWFAMGRFLTILGAAGAFITTVKAMGEDFDSITSKIMVGRIIGCTVLCSIAFIKLVIPYLTGITNGWRYFYGIKGILMIGVTLYFFNLCNNGNKSTNNSKNLNIYQCYQLIINNKKIIYLMIFSFFFFMIYYCAAETQYLGQILNEYWFITKENTYSLLLSGYFLGFTTTPIFYKAIGHIKLILLTISLLILCTMMILLKIHYVLAYILLLLIGFSNGFQILVLDIIAKETPKEYTGTFSALLNVLFVGGAFLPQQILFKIVPLLSIGSKTLLYLIIFIGIISFTIIIKLLKNNHWIDYNNI